MKCIIVVTKIIFASLLMGFPFFYVKVIGQPVKLSPTSRWMAKHTPISLNENPASNTLIRDIVYTRSFYKISFIESNIKLTPNKILN